MIKDEKCCQERRNNMVKRVRRAERMEATAQKVAVVKRRQPVIRTKNLQRFKETVNNTNQPIKRAGNLHAPQGANETGYPSIGGNIDHKRERSQEPRTPTLSERTK